MLNGKGQVGITVLIVLGFIVGFAIFGSIVTIDTGNLGIVKEFGKVTGAILQPGLAFKNPFTQDVIEMSTRVKLMTKTSSSASKDMQTVTIVSAINYQMDASKIIDIYSKYGINYEEIVINPLIDEVVKANTAQYTASELLTKREEVKIKIFNDLNEKLSKFNIMIIEYSLNDIDYSPEYNKAIEAKQVAEQNALKAEQELKMVQIQTQQQVATATANAEATRLNAQADADSILLRAQAQAQANTLLTETLDDNILRKQWNEKWNGVLPTYILGSDANLFLGLGE